MIAVYRSRVIPFCRRNSCRTADNSFRTIDFLYRLILSVKTVISSLIEQSFLVKISNFVQFLLITSTTVSSSNSSSSTSFCNCSRESTFSRTSCPKIFEISLQSCASCNLHTISILSSVIQQHLQSVLF